MTRTSSAAVALALGLSFTSCGSDLSLDRTGVLPFELIGTVEYVSLEGGFFAIRADSGELYEPLGRLPNRFSEDGRKVRVLARERRDMASVRMVGPIIELLRIEAL